MERVSVRGHAHVHLAGPEVAVRSVSKYEVYNLDFSFKTPYITKFYCI